MPKVVKFTFYGITWEFMGVNGKLYANDGLLYRFLFVFYVVREQ